MRSQGGNTVLPGILLIADIPHNTDRADPVNDSPTIHRGGLSSPFFVHAVDGTLPADGAD